MVKVGKIVKMKMVYLKIDGWLCYRTANAVGLKIEWDVPDIFAPQRRCVRWDLAITFFISWTVVTVVTLKGIRASTALT